MAINRKTYRRSMGQFKRHHGTLILGSEDRKAPYFKVTQEMYQFKRLFPTQERMITRYENKMLKSRSLATQNKLRADMMDKLRRD
jgi:hypothetical protein